MSPKLRLADVKARLGDPRAMHAFRRAPTLREVREELLQLAELQRAAAHRLLTLALQLPRGPRSRTK